MRAEAGPIGPGRLPQRILLDAVRNRTSSTLVTVHAYGAGPSVCDSGTAGQRDATRCKTQLVRVRGVVWIMAGLTANRFINRVGHIATRITDVLDVTRKTASSVTTNAVSPAWPGGSSRRDRVPGIIPFGAAHVVRL